jgi:hypothetical protein
VVFSEPEIAAEVIEAVMSGLEGALKGGRRKT